MVQSFKSSNKKLILLFLVSLVMIISFIGCGTNKRLLVNNQGKELIFGDSVFKTGVIIYDSEIKSARFLESDIKSIEDLTKRKLKNLYDSAKYIILLREGIKYTKNPHQLSLTLCKEKNIIVKRDELLFKKYAFISVEKILFYEVKNEYDDSKERLVFCKND